MQVYLHGEALPTASVGTAERPLAVVVAEHVVLETEATGELFVTAFPGARQHPPFPGVDTQLMLVQVPGVVKALLALSAQHLD